MVPTNIFGVALYIFALFPGIIFAFSRERHKPSVKRTAFRETTTVLLVSAICDGAVFLAIVGISFAVPEIGRVGLSFFAPWNKLDAYGVLWLVLLAVGSFSATLALGWFLGSAAMDGTAVGKFLQSNTTLVDPNASAWGYSFTVGPDNQAWDGLTLVGLQLKSGTWVQGYLHRYDNVSDGDVRRALTLAGEIKIRPVGSVVKPKKVDGFGIMIIEAAEIEYLLVGYEEPTGEAGSSTK
jgi:Family of unknown function (DUF6338)